MKSVYALNTWNITLLFNHSYLNNFQNHSSKELLKSGLFQEE